ncbi:hypothetical protein BO94DRAFT_120451 [Aspergillus sclerotioniger CBS 115572]|uniref:Secreted protein n=1 Tax=Aspergillus sclerotioniger CBS 115572 TaxID=1450535 RepID=A0A317WD94_9EURO|nr:hypothetical protein BO94DRAFT_120451 [Aspergillus sclerotioniger CBS 115572]PWY83172.1 hypothetical protein BO94DRAFT_120451 [Aspergillus sclerotioniger CBS 115572]
MCNCACTMVPVLGLFEMAVISCSVRCVCENRSYLSLLSQPTPRLEGIPSGIRNTESLRKRTPSMCMAQSPSGRHQSHPPSCLRSIEIFVPCYYCSNIITYYVPTQ